MIYRLEIENFASIREKQVIDLTVKPSVKDDPEKFAPLFPGSALRAPKVVAVFGANASGKTNVLRALSFLRSFLTNGADSPKYWRPTPFYDEESQKRQIKVALELSAVADLKDWVKKNEMQSVQKFSLYRYEVEFEQSDIGFPLVVREALAQKISGRGKWKRVFERSRNGPVHGSSAFQLKGLGQLVEKIRPNVSVIYTLGFVDHQPSRLIIDAANQLWTNIEIEKIEPFDANVSEYFANAPEVLNQLNRDLPVFDLGIEQVEVTKNLSQDWVLMYKHAGLRGYLPWWMESHGTRMFVRVYPWIHNALLSGSVAVLDELDSALHPHMLREVVSWFYSPERNPKNAQLWLTCHSATLLEELAAEEVLLCEKDDLGRTSVYGLKEVEGARRDDNRYKKYLGGVYGAVPHFG